MIDYQIIKKIIDVWNDDQNHPYRERSTINLNFEHVKIMVETAFLASLKREEDRPIRFAIILTNSDLVEKSRDPISFLNFPSPLPFTVDTLTKLAPAFDPEMSAIAISDDPDQVLKVWGVFTYEPTTNIFTEIGGSAKACRPDMFTIRVKQPGSLLISRSNSQIGRLVNAEFLPATPSPFSSKSFGRYMLNMIQEHKLYKKHTNNYWRYYLGAIKLLISEAADRGHGSTIVFIDPDKFESYKTLFQIQYQLSPNFNLELEEEFEGILENKEIVLARKKRIIERIKILSQLAVIDGALILSTKLDLIAFGAKLGAPKWKFDTIIGPDGYGSEVRENFEHDRLGTRHNSAIDFVGACTDSYVFVISQDGPVRAFVKHDAKTIYCWRDCSISMFVE